MARLAGVAAWLAAVQAGANPNDEAHRRAVPHQAPAPAHQAPAAPAHQPSAFQPSGPAHHPSPAPLPSQGQPRPPAYQPQRSTQVHQQPVPPPPQPQGHSQPFQPSGPAQAHQPPTPYQAPGEVRRPFPQEHGHPAPAEANRGGPAPMEPHRGPSPRPEGGQRVEAPGGRHFDVRPNGSVATFTSPRGSATFRPNGHVATLRAGPLQVHRAAGGGRVVFHERADHSMVVSAGPRFGYVQRPFYAHHLPYVQRTYVVGDAVYTHAYSPFRYHGAVFYRYAPSVYYAPAYYRWAYRPWARPIAFSWGWAGSPWHRYYGSYFVPMPYYPAPHYWLADFLVAAALQEAYLAHASAPPPAYATAPAYAEAPPPPVATAPITPAVREAIALEVRRELEEERLNAETYRPPSPEAAPASPEEAAGPPPAVSEPPPYLRQPGRVFVAATPLDVLVDGQSCSLSAGDVLQLDAVPPGDAQAVPLRVLSSKPGDCPAGARPLLSVSDLQEMYNGFHEKLDSGLAQMRSSQSAGMPPPPPDAQAYFEGPGAAASAPVENAAETVAEAQTGADQAERELEEEMSAERPATP